MSSALVIVVLLCVAHPIALLFTTRGKHFKQASLLEKSQFIDNVGSTAARTSPPASPDLKPYVLPPLRDRTSGMGLKRLDSGNWLTMDENYLPEHDLRASYLTNVLPSVIQTLPAAEAACHETLEKVVSFLTSRFPQHFSLVPRWLPFSARQVHNHLTGESFIIGAKCPNPLETAARLAMEDFNILMKDPKTGDYSLKASATLFPTGWKLQDRIGMSMKNLHLPVPRWQEKLSVHVNRYFDHLSSRTTMERANLFIQTTPNLFQDRPETLPESAPPLRPKQCMVRRERQTFTRLEKSGAVLFTVRSYMKPLTELENDETKALLGQITAWDESVRSYKGWSVWGDVVEQWCLGNPREGEKEVGRIEEEMAMKSEI